MVSLKLSQPGLFGPLQLEDPAAGGIGIWPVQVTVGLVPDTVPEVGIAPLATAETRRRIDARTAARTGKRPLALLALGRRLEAICSSFNNAIRRDCRGSVESARIWLLGIWKSIVVLPSPRVFTIRASQLPNERDPNGGIDPRR